MLFNITKSIEKRLESIPAADLMKKNVHTILIIDDELEVCILVENFLNKKNKQAAHSTTLKDGIEKFKKLKPDLLILDHNLPDGYGINSIPLFKELDQSIKVVIISAMSDLKKQAIEKGADYFIEKPISFSALNLILLNH
ncbi:MAG: response regulator [Bacteroidetes bacterium]|nr:response regulator [Bacteroidota bacterium]